MAIIYRLSLNIGDSVMALKLPVTMQMIDSRRAEDIMQNIILELKKTLMLMAYDSTGPRYIWEIYLREKEAMWNL